MVGATTIWPEYGPDSSPVDEPFPTPLPQEVVANFGLSQVVGGKLMIACRIPTADASERVSSLDPNDYKALLLAVKGNTREQIAVAMDMPVYATQEHRYLAYKKLGAPEDPEEAASFIPMSKEYFESFQLEKLAWTDRNILLGLGEGLNYRGIAERHNLSLNTVRGHKSDLARQLGVNGNPDLASLRLRRLGGAFFTLRSSSS